MRQKRMISLLLSLVILAALCGCNAAKEKLHIGYVLSDALSEAYRQVCLDGIEKSRADMELSDRQISIVDGASADDCYYKTLELVKNDCEVIVGFGAELEDGLVQAATEQPDILFFTANGVQATNGLPNYRCFAMPELSSRYVSGVAAGAKLNDLLQNGEIAADGAVLGYIAAFPDENSRTAYRAFYLGAVSVCETVRMNVQYTYSECNAADEKKAARALIANGSRVLSKQSELEGVAATCAESDAYFVGFLQDESRSVPEHFIAAAKLDLSVNLTYIVDSLLKKETIPRQFGIPPEEADGFLSRINEKAFSNAKSFEAAQKAVTEAASSLPESFLIETDGITELNYTEDYFTEEESENENDA